MKEWWSRLFDKESMEKASGRSIAWPEEQQRQFAQWQEALAGTMPHNSQYASQFTAATLVSRVAKMVLLELETGVVGSPMAEYVHRQYTRFVNKKPGGLRSATQEGLALSRYLLYPYVRQNNIAVALLPVSGYFPVQVDEGGGITAVVVPIGLEKNGVFYTLLVDLDYSPAKKTYRMGYSAFASKNQNELGSPVPLGTVQEWEHLRDVTFHDVERPWFVEYTSPNGSSLFSRALDTFRKIDKLESQLEWEFDGAERAVFTPTGMFRDMGQKDALHPEKSRVKLALPQGKERLYVQTNIAPDALQKPETYQPPIRDESFRRRRNDLDRQVEDHCELARGTISNVNLQSQTATEIERSRQVTLTTVADIQTATQQVLEQLVEVMADIAWRYGLAPKGVCAPTFEWDDSVLDGRETEVAERMQAQEAGWLSAVENRAWYTGESLPIAAQNMPQAAGEKAQAADIPPLV